MIEVLRLTHRIKRDKRVTTHVCLTARAFNAKKIFYSGDRDIKLESTINTIIKNFGGPFSISYNKNPTKLIKEKKKKKCCIVNLTMYGILINKKIKEIRKNKNILIIVGSEKVPIGFYKLSNYNIAISNQPHSEISALAVFLYEYFNKKFPNFKNAKLKVIPRENSKYLKKI